MSLKDKFVDYSYERKDIKKLSVKDEDDLEYMSSVSSAMLMQNNLKTKLLLWIGMFVIIWLIAWAYNAKIDALTRGQGKIIPSNKIQVIQNLEGGIVSELLVKEGDTVKKGDILVKIDDTNFASMFIESQLRYNELEAKTIRLLAESTGNAFSATKEIRKKSPELIKHEFSLYRTNKEQLNNNIMIYNRRLNQKRNELKEAQAKLIQLTNNYTLISREVALNKPLVKKGIVSEVEFLQLQRQQSTIQGEMGAIELSIPRLISVLEEQKDNIREVELAFHNAAKEAYNEAKAEMTRIKRTNIAREDKVQRTFVRSPVTGTIKQLLINTVGGVVKPGMDIIEIVPTQDNLLVEAKIRPADIAFLYPGQRAIVKFSAYDFAIYGSLQGTLTHISAGTIVDEIDKQSYYLVRVKTDKNYLGNEDKKLNVIVGMTADVDIITGKKTVLDYILKPILRARENVLSER
ncbi:type I secretion membrane fusion protein, HlyD family [Sulfurimonas gotlandica GD1]|uniref:Type I secretion membrane fusion protein, HlyD family n=1 Tax=Sulfurimonas gotlandica (strain DSM 19862 / JCM 16533 / GD1) TaxID=929558 RepID=B6BJZ3_SULGG|nr:HlyD family type I secretion periplasmic adaptor subunit [Sulfurimonas gotlandica]EDZ62626.1 secretion protein, HlyD family [Sulfurimonas gotlandica GD1]EHP31397.1 type I secretion membrane fusion protein, HlyD family [Sulfurimonas gotlandica GD1]